ncbi:hypothetical protein ACCQ08_25555 [Comamonas sp. SY3]|uniref:hypothetical protein n=1 Tax=Comamonas sp. SY3 TaxID=3243601 RepID=UPI003593F070
MIKHPNEIRTVFEAITAIEDLGNSISHADSISDAQNKTPTQLQRVASRYDELHPVITKIIENADPRQLTSDEKSSLLKHLEAVGSGADRKAYVSIGIIRSTLESRKVKF